MERSIGREWVGFLKPDSIMAGWFEGDRPARRSADPVSGDLFLISKALSFRARIFSARAPLLPGPSRTLEDVGRVRAGWPVMGGDISPRGDQDVLRTDLQALRWTPPRQKRLPWACRPPPARSRRCMSRGAKRSALLPIPSPPASIP